MSSVPPWLSTTKLDTVKYLPDYGYRVNFNHIFKEKCRPFMLPHWHQIPYYITFSLRYAYIWLAHWWKGKKLFIDNMSLAPWEPIYGAPLGGIGSGSIGRGFKGEFCRIQIIPGFFERSIFPGNQFILTIRHASRTVYQKALGPSPPKNSQLSAWEYEMPEGLYHALYPRAWYIYRVEEFGLTLTCKQMSPFIPNDYKDSSLPCGLFVWSVDLEENKDFEELEITVSFMFQNRISNDPGAAFKSASVETYRVKDNVGSSSGVALHQDCLDYKYSLVVSAKCKDDVEVNTKRQYPIEEGGFEVWNELKLMGRFEPEQLGMESVEESEIGFGVSCSAVVKPGRTTEFEFCLVWYMPEFQFKGKQFTHKRWYSQFFGGNNGAVDLANYALSKQSDWDSKITSWQSEILDNETLPSFYKSALFNELYYLADGGSVWVIPPEGGEESLPQVLKDYGRFAYLEGQEYRMYNTFDVHHYASFALLELWPKLQLSLQYDIERTIEKEQNDNVMFIMDGSRGKSKVSGSVPHDIGDPDNEPWHELNTYTIHPTNNWRDLNLKFILQVGRDFAHTQDLVYLRDMYPAVKKLILKCLEWDLDGDGIIENGGFPDQTYDAWVMTGVSAYCGGMWLACVRIMMELAKRMGEDDDLSFFNKLLEKAVPKYHEILWNGCYYNFDSSCNAYHDSVMADQLAGHWFLRSAHIDDYTTFPKDNVLATLKSIYKHNICPFAEGTMGAINGSRPKDSTPDYTSPQSDEFWVGVTYGLAATMLYEGEDDMAWQTAYGAYHTCWERYGLAFQTPEAYFLDRRFRSLGYMRALTVWAMNYALRGRSSKK